MRMDTQYDREKSDGKNDVANFDRRQKARNRMRRLRLERKARIDSRIPLAGKNLQRGEHVVDLAPIEGEQTSEKTSPAILRVQVAVSGQNERDGQLQHEAQAIDHHRCVL